MLDLFGLIKLTCFEGGTSFFEQALEAVVVECELNVSDFIHVLGNALVSVLSHKPFFDFMTQILLKLHHSVFFPHVFIRKELHVLSASNFSLHRVVWKCDQMAVEKLVIDFVWSFKNDYGISVDEADEEPEHGSTEPHDILKEYHFFILFALCLNEKEDVIVVLKRVDIVT